MDKSRYVQELATILGPQNVLREAVRYIALV